MAQRSHSQVPKARRQFQTLARLLPMVSGSLVEQYVICGKPRCRSTRGQKHGPLYYLYCKEQARSRWLYVPREWVSELRRVAGQMANGVESQRKINRGAHPRPYQVQTKWTHARNRSFNRQRPKTPPFRNVAKEWATRQPSLCSRGILTTATVPLNNCTKGFPS
jgi:hypothetical protein